MSLIRLEQVTKSFRTQQRASGLKASLKSLIKRDYITKHAVHELSFQINKGELIGYIGANGAGKSTTIKMMTGILVPTSGSITVDGRNPYKHRKENAKKIGVVFGQRSQLYWNLPMEETFELYKKIYKIEQHIYRRNVDFYVELLEMNHFLTTPVRQLSLGQRMRAELVVALLHDPEILYLDEPTIGLDVHVKEKIRLFINEINKTKHTTVILTTHDMNDIDAVCNRIITINEGQLIYDGSIDQFKQSFSTGHKLIVEFTTTQPQINDPRLKLIDSNENQFTFLINKDEISMSDAISSLATTNNIIDLKISEPNIEEAVKSLFRG